MNFIVIIWIIIKNRVIMLFNRIPISMVIMEKNRCYYHYFALLEVDKMAENLLKGIQNTLRHKLQNVNGFKQLQVKNKFKTLYGTDKNTQQIP